MKTTIAMLLLAGASGCASVRSILATDTSETDRKPISNPFAGFSAGSERPDTMIFRAKKGDGAVEVEVPRSGQNISEFVIPISPDMRIVRDGGRSPASSGTPTEPAQDAPGYPQMAPTLTDREITRTFPQGLPEDENKRREIEQELGLMRTDESPEKESSYLAALDHVKQLYRGARYEAALIQVDQLLREYPTNPKLYQMRGTLLDRIGQHDLAIQSWKQALRFDQKNESLRRFVERKEQKRSLASP